MKSSLKAAAATFSVTCAVGDPTHSRTGARVAEVHGDLKSTIVLLSDDYTQVAFVTSPLGIESTEFRGAIYARLGQLLGLEPEQVVCMTSHDHCVPASVDDATYLWQKPPGIAPVGRLNALGERFIAGLDQAARSLAAALEPVTVDWGKALESSFVYNRRGRRPDGRAYFIREEDRVLLPPDYTGEIDPEAMVVCFQGATGRTVAALAFYTGHPITAFNPERMVVFGEWPQVACEQLSAHLGGAPVGFVQGCCGNINSKHMLSGTVEQSREFGRRLGEAFIRAYATRTPSVRGDLRRKSFTTGLPLAALPPLGQIEADLAEIDDFIRRGRTGDPATLECVGMNFPRALSPGYRAELVNMIRPWFVWARGMHRAGRADAVPAEYPVDIVVVRVGDVGVVGLPFEPFVRIGLRIKREAGLPCVLPCGYTNAAHGYVPDASACADREYMAGFFRYTRNRPPFAPPAGEAAASAAVQALEEISR